MPDSWFKRLFQILQIAVVAVFLGRAWQYLYWDAPYRVLLWDEDWIKPIVQVIFGMQWEDYVTNLSIDKGIQVVIRLTGVFYLICALAAIFIQRWKPIARILLWVGAFNLVFLAALYCKDKFFHLGQFLEYTLQWSSPIFLIVLSQLQTVGRSFLFWLRVAIALTFVCHGLYAIGYYPRPGDFLQMTIAILKINETGAMHFLQIAGLLDFMASVLIFLPGKIGKAALWYCVFWGLATTLARIVAPLELGMSIENVMLQSLHESVYRFPHFLVPLFAAIALHQSTITANSNRQNIGNVQQL